MALHTDVPTITTWNQAGLKALHHPSLKDRPVIITGGSRGFGWFMAEALLGAGAKVTLTGRDSETLAAVQRRADEIAGPGRCITVTADTTKWDDCVRVIDDTLAAFGHFDVLINNAGRGPMEFDIGINQNSTAFYNIPEHAFRAIMETNVMGVFLMSKAAMPHFLERKSGKIFSISTSLLNMVRAGNSTYGGSKAALEASHRCWAAELKATGIDVNILLPGGGSDTALISSKIYEGKIGERAGVKGLLPGDIIVPAAMWLCTDATKGMSGERVIAKEWDIDLAPEAAFAKCLQPHNEVPGIM